MVEWYEGAGGIGVTMHDIWFDPLRCVSGDWLVVVIAYA